MDNKLIEIWQEHNDQLLSFIKKRIVNQENAEDMLQDVYIKLHKNIHKLRDEQKIVPWIYQVVRNTLNDCYRKCGRENYVEFNEKHIELDIKEENNLNDEVISSMKRIIEELPSKSGEIVKLYEFEDMSHQDLSDKLGINLNTSKSRLKRARNKLKKQLDECCVFQLDKFGNVLDYQKKIKKHTNN